MNYGLLALTLASLTFSTAVHGAGKTPAPDELSTAELHSTLAALDEKLFGASNRCDLETFQSLLADDLEFYHDQAGVTWSAQALTTATRENICGKVRRELVPGTLEVDRIKGFGAIEMGSHRFCEVATGNCVGIARFMHVWKHEDGKWKISRVISYGHRPLSEAK